MVVRVRGSRPYRPLVNFRPKYAPTNQNTSFVSFLFLQQQTQQPANQGNYNKATNTTKSTTTNYNNMKMEAECKALQQQMLELEQLDSNTDHFVEIYNNTADTKYTNIQMIVDAVGSALYHFQLYPTHPKQKDQIVKMQNWITKSLLLFSRINHDALQQPNGALISWLKTFKTPNPQYPNNFEGTNWKKVFLAAFCEMYEEK